MLRRDSGSPVHSSPGRDGLPVALLMPGQGAQYDGMGTGLYRDCPAFAAIVDEVFGLMGREGDELRAGWLAVCPALPADHASRSQPLLFAVDYALGRLLMNLGLRPAALLGHSIGEVAAATLAGVFSLDGAVGLLRFRSAQLAEAPAGGMVAVAASREEVTAHLGPGVDIAAVNAPRQTIIAGPGEPLRGTCAALADAGFSWARVSSHTPFHSALLEPMVGPGYRVLARTPMTPPAIPLVSGYTGKLLRGAEATSPWYWARHPVEPVLFWPAVGRLLATGVSVLAECGPGDGLITLARRHPDVRARRCEVLSLLGTRTSGPGTEAEQLAAATAGLGLHLP
jgi:[acyl-carrier-protein] S-malonyltransferase